MADNILFGEKALAFFTKPTATPLGSGFPFCGPALSFLSFFFKKKNNLAAHIGVFSLGLSNH